MASVSLATPVVGPAENRAVTLTATPGAPSNVNIPVRVHWAVTTSAIPNGYVGGIGPNVTVFPAGSLDPGTYNVRVLVFDPGDNSTAEASETFVLPSLPNLGGTDQGDTLSIPGTTRQLVAGATSVNTVLTNTCRRISVVARGSDIRYMIGSTAQTANATTSHWISVGERLDLALPPTPNLAIIRVGAVNGTLEVTELL